MKNTVREAILLNKLCLDKDYSIVKLDDTVLLL